MVRFLALGVLLIGSVSAASDGRNAEVPCYALLDVEPETFRQLIRASYEQHVKRARDAGALNARDAALLAIDPFTVDPSQAPTPPRDALTQALAALKNLVDLQHLAPAELATLVELLSQTVTTTCSAPPRPEAGFAPGTLLRFGIKATAPRSSTSDYYGFAISPDGRFVAMSDGSGGMHGDATSSKLTLWSVETGQAVWTRDVTGDINVRALRFSARHPWLVFSHGKNEVSVLQLSNGAPLLSQALPPETAVQALIIDEEANTVLAAFASGRAPFFKELAGRVFSVAHSRRQADRLDPAQTLAWAMRIMPGLEGAIAGIDVGQSGDPEQDQYRRGHGIARLMRGEPLIHGNLDTDGESRRHRASTEYTITEGGRSTTIEITLPDENVSDPLPTAVSGNGRYFAVAFRSGSVAVWDLEHRELMHHFPTGLKEIGYLRLDAEGKRLFVAGRLKPFVETPGAYSYDHRLGIWELPH